MKSIFAIAILLSTSVFADEYNPKMLLSDLPDGAVLVVKKEFQLGSTSYDADEYYHATFESGETDTGMDITSLSFPWYTRVLLRTDSNVATKTKRVAELLYTHSAQFIKEDRYCLNRGKSDFPVRNDLDMDIGQDRLLFELCSTGEAAFAIYTNAGWGMIHKQGLMHFTVGRFHHHTGQYMHFER